MFDNFVVCIGTLFLSILNRMMKGLVLPQLIPDTECLVWCQFSKIVYVKKDTSAWPAWL
jgi:hypothetical protein